MSELPSALYRAAQVRELDRIAIQTFGIPGLTLMERAGRATFAALRRRWPEARRLAVLCGTGNNGGDGFVVARLAHEAGLVVEVLQVGDAARLAGDALAAAEALRAAGVEPRNFGPGRFPEADVVVDALFGTGLEREVTGVWREAVGAINASGAGVVAVDIPSGLHADTGAVLGAAVRAQVTVTFIGLKQGLFTAMGPDHCGTVLFDDLQVPPGVYASVTPAARRIRPEDLAVRLAPRPRGAHKGDHGHVLVVGGERGMAGAARMAGEAAARVGSGLVTVATRPEQAAVLAGVRPELMCHGVEGPRDLLPLLRRATVVAIGPGLGRSRWAQGLFTAVLDTKLPLVVDADALNLLAAEPVARGNWVLTPHPGEAARLLGSASQAVQADRFSAVAQLAQRYRAVAVLKGAGTLVQAEDGAVWLCDRGNPGMATGGMGDVLTGVIAGLAGQGLPLAEAAWAGVHLHAVAGDAAARDGERGMLALDLMPHLRRAANPAGV